MRREETGPRLRIEESADQQVLRGIVASTVHPVIQDQGQGWDQSKLF